LRLQVSTPLSWKPTKEYHFFLNECPIICFVFDVYFNQDISRNNECTILGLLERSNGAISRDKKIIVGGDQDEKLSKRTKLIDNDFDFTVDLLKNIFYLPYLHKTYIKQTAFTKAFSVNQ
jgi:hypothetical protein